MRPCAPPSGRKFLTRLDDVLFRPSRARTMKGIARDPSCGPAEMLAEKKKKKKKTRQITL